MAGLCLAAVVGIVGACSSDDGNGGDSSFSDVSVGDAEVAVDDARSELSAGLRQEGLTSLASALDVVDIAQLVDVAEFTLLAPSDQAFQAMDPDQMADLLADPVNLLEVLRNHVIDERISAHDLAAMSSIRTLAGNDLDVSDSDGVLMIDGAGVSSVDLSVDNGTVHIVDRIFVP